MGDGGVHLDRLGQLLRSDRTNIIIPQPDWSLREYEDVILPQLCFSVKEGHPVLHAPLSGRLHFSLPLFHPNNGPSPGVVCAVRIWAENSENNPEVR
jgi:hypothetical protein